MDGFASRLFEPIPGLQVALAEGPDYDVLLSCIRCARCLPVCPTYQETLHEVQSPRGRLALLRAVEEGRLPFDETVEAHLYHCLDCRACNTVCPAGVPIGELIVAGRAAAAVQRPRPWWLRLLLERALGSPRAAEWAAAPLRWAWRLGLIPLARRFLHFLPPLRELLDLAPRPSPPVRKELARRASPPAPRYRVGFFLGCVMNAVYGDVVRSSVRLLERLGCAVIVPPDQVCCGAPQDDQGLRETARRFARRNIAAFEALGPLDAIVADCAACSGFLKEYAHLLADDPEWADRARAFAARVRDLTEWLEAIWPEDLRPVAPGLRFTYHEPCHLSHVQGVRRPPRALLRRLQGTTFRELPDATRCCGSAGIYNLTHPAMSRRLLERKMADIAATEASVVVTANPGCMLQLEWGARRSGSAIQVRHLSEVLDAALSASEEGEGRGGWDAG
ncbi:Lactate utilization protein A [Candidatus Thermoflexus japonica]|uniref:Glycolate oxidase iron-sulfur subunit n=1 Tax=Candidatus Thermoflexus japonica TaxID=2035417 RepID=A0A2H5Y9W3_9CHLR|nr:Lactate utilization protein A [Candidatus Thermoflexus japonica]